MRPGDLEQLRLLIKKVYSTCMHMMQLATVTDVADLIYSARSGAAGQFKLSSGGVAEWVALVQSCASHPRQVFVLRCVWQSVWLCCLDQLQANAILMHVRICVQPCAAPGRGAAQQVHCHDKCSCGHHAMSNVRRLQLNEAAHAAGRGVAQQVLC